jgi:hypothetical protein
LAELRAALAELLAELPDADQRNLLQALESLRAVLAHDTLNRSRLVAAARSLWTVAPL